ncbi:MAG TPA: hypothetical protein PLN60_11080, partial [Bacillota bacterium]|nr:hypothetical protein [Bacillota bacterium]
MRRSWFWLLFFVVACCVFIFAVGAEVSAGRYDYEITCQYHDLYGRGIHCSVASHIEDPQFYRFTGHGYVFLKEKEAPGYKFSLLTRTPNQSFVAQWFTVGTWYLHVYSYHDIYERGRYTPAWKYARFGPYTIGGGGGGGSGGSPAPTVKAVPESRGWSKESVSVSLTFGYTTSQRARWVGGSWTSSSSSSSRIMQKSEDGEWYLEVEASGPGGKTTKRFGPYRIDKTPPTVKADPSSRAWNTSNVSVSLTFSDSGGSGFKRQRVAWSTSTSTPGSGWTSWSSSTSRTASQSSNGVWYLHVQAEDNAGNRRSTYFGPYRIDKTPPTVKADPSSRAWNTSNVSVSLTFSDSGGSGFKRQRVAWSTSTSTPGSGWTSWSSSTSRTASQSSNGVWYLHVQAEDNAGNRRSTYFGPYRIDKVKPRVMLDPPSGGFVESGSVVARFFDDHSGVKRYRVGVSDSSDKRPSSWSWVSVSGGPKSVSKSVSLPGYGVWYVHARVEDNVGLKSDVVVGGPYVVLNKLKVPLYRRWVYLED